MESDIIARIDKELSDCEIAGWEDVPFPEELLMECKEEIIAASSRWIPVSERVPDEDKEQFLVASGDYIGVAWWHAGPQKFIHEDIDNAWTPTHWMPLPEPPGVV